MSTSSTDVPREFYQRTRVEMFMSYGHIDNQANWVTHFHTALQRRLQELLGTERVVIWRDVKLNGTDAFEDVIRKSVAGSALFVSVLSPRYIRLRPPVRTSSNWFVAAGEQGNGLRLETQSRLIRVVKTRLPLGPQPSNFNATLGYEFYESDPQNPDIFKEYPAQEGMPGFGNPQIASASWRRQYRGGIKDETVQPAPQGIAPKDIPGQHDQ